MYLTESRVASTVKSLPYKYPSILNFILENYLKRIKKVSLVEKKT